MIKKILLDLDGVLVDFVGGACELHGVDDPYASGEADAAGEYDVIKLLGMRAQTFWAPMGYEFWANLKPYAHLRRVVDLAESAVGAENICILTSPPLTAGAVEGKMAWIRKHLPDYRRRFLVGPAKEFCAAPDHLLIDDYQRNIDRFCGAGGQGLLFPAPWNDLHAQDAVAAVEQVLTA
jgi:5'(3')-deoxyribonucleotidase